jgi:hypothetical protein
MYFGLGVPYRRILDCMVGFIDTLYIQLVTTGDNSTIADLHTLQFNRFTYTTVLELH